MQDSHYQLNRPLYLLTAIYLLWLLAVLLIFGYTPTNDGMGYIEYAEHCLSQGQPYPTTTVYQTAPFIWNIGIINLVELSLWLTRSVYPVLLLMCVLKSITCLMTGLLSQRLFNSQRIAITVMILFMLYPNNWGQSTMISSEIPSTCLAITAVYVSVIKHYALSIKHYACGFSLAMANWFRPTATVFLISIIIYLILFQRSRLIKKTCQIVMGFALFVVITGGACYLRTGHFVYQARSYWFSMVDECYDGADVAPHWGQPIWPEGTPRYIDNHEELNCFDYERIWRDRSISWLKEHPADYLMKIPGRLYYMFQSDYDNMTAFMSDKSQPENNYITIPFQQLLKKCSELTAVQWLSLICLAYYYCLLILALLGTIQSIRQGSYESLFLPLFLVLGGSLALVLVMHGETRFKDSFMPCIFILAATCITHHTTFITHHPKA